MLTCLDHIVLVCRNLEKAKSDYQRLFGFAPSWESTDTEHGLNSAIFRFENTALEILAPIDGPSAHQRISELLGERDSVLTSLAFESGNIGETHRVLMRRGGQPSETSIGSSIDLESGKERSWKRLRCDDGVCTGIKTFVLEHDQRRPAVTERTGGVKRLDHLVINTPNPDRAIAHYGARLGLRLALDRTIEAFSTRFLFFRIGGLTLEIIHRLDNGAQPSQPDSLWGLTWAVDDLEVERHRLSSAGLDVSAIRAGRKPGSRVFTLRSGTMGVPTLFISHDARD